jgi:ABC-type cobalamin transport system permease subunit
MPTVLSASGRSAASYPIREPRTVASLLVPDSIALSPVPFGQHFAVALSEPT